MIFGMLGIMNIYWLHRIFFRTCKFGFKGFIGFHYIYWVVVSNTFYFHPYQGKCSKLTNLFQLG